MANLNMHSMQKRTRVLFQLGPLCCITRLPVLPAVGERELAQRARRKELGNCVCRDMTTALDAAEFEPA
jgi:hypothetical protein